MEKRLCISDRDSVTSKIIEKFRCNLTSSSGGFPETEDILFFPELISVSRECLKTALYLCCLISNFCLTNSDLTTTDYESALAESPRNVNGRISSNQSCAWGFIGSSDKIKSLQVILARLD